LALPSLAGSGIVQREEGSIMADSGRPTIHYTELTDLPPDHVLYHEWNTYRRELPRLLAEGQEGKYALLKGEAIVGIFEAESQAFAEGRKRFLMEPFMIQPIRSEEAILRTPWLYRSSCRT
jgi:hypothetical protein